MRQNVTETVAILKRALASDFRIMPLYAPDVPVFMAVAWPTADGVTGHKPRLPAGRGTTLTQAMLSAGAEALELRASLAKNHLSSLTGLEPQAGIAMVAARDLLSGETVPVPARQVYLDYAAVTGQAPVDEADSTGCATSLTPQDAIRHALLECLERDAVALWWHGGLPCHAMPIDMIDAEQPRLCWWLTQRERRTLLLDLTCDTGVTVVVGVSSQPDGRGVAIGSAANVRPSAAALAAITEMIQTEVAIKQATEAGDPEVMVWAQHASTQTMPQFQPSPFGPPKPGHPELGGAGWGNHDSGMANILRRLSDLGHRALTMDLTLTNDPFPTARVIVPGLCAMGGRIHVPRFDRLSARWGSGRHSHGPPGLEPF